MKRYFLLVLLASLVIQANAQNDKSWLAIETDPMTTVFGAKTISLLVEPEGLKHWSIFTNLVSADFPQWMDDLLNPKNKDKGIDSKIKIGGGFALDYFFKPEREGYYVGLINLFFNNELEKGVARETVLSHNIIPRVGYRWCPFKGRNFYLNPFLGIRYEYLIEEAVSLQGETFKAAGIQPFGTVHIGYHF
ncbi:MAG: hypothetical protein HEP71_26575 [Roseivirga sp.]|nr:hypothetical protein [Roseivirga sp.]